MVSEHACDACGRGTASPGYLVVERAYWYPDEPEFVAKASRWPLTAGAGHGPALLEPVRPSGAAAPLRLAISPAANALAVERFCDALASRPAVRGVELEQFVGAMAVLTVDAISLPDVVAALLEMDGYPMVGLTVTGDGQISLRLDEQALARATPLPRPAPPQSAPAVSSESLSSLQARIARISQDLSALGATTPAGAAIQPRPSVEHPIIEYSPSAASWQPVDSEPPSATTSTPAVGSHIAQALDRLAALRRDASSDAEREESQPPGATEEGAGEDDTTTPAIFARPLSRDRLPTPFLRASQPGEEGPADAPNWAAAETRTAVIGAATASSAPSTPQSVQVIAYPFENFSGVNSFINAVRALPDVRYVAPRRFRAGTIQLAVDYAGGESLAERLRSLTAFTPRIVSEDDESVTLTIGNAS